MLKTLENKLSRIDFLEFGLAVKVNELLDPVRSYWEHIGGTFVKLLLHTFAWKILR